MEPDRASSIQAVVERYPEITLVGNAKTFPMLKLYFDLDTSRALTVKEGDTLKLGRHELTFVMAPMVHWPEVMVSYDSCDKGAVPVPTLSASSVRLMWMRTGTARRDGIISIL